MDFSFAVSTDLDKFLKTEDLDDLLKVKINLRNLNKNDEKKIRSILKKWKNPQAVSNLLFYPSLIPEDIRISYLLKGLEEREELYYILASAVGFQEIDTTRLSEEEKKAIKEHLILTLKTTDGVVSARASVSIHEFLSSADTPIMFELLVHPDEATRHNILAWLITTMEETDSEKFIPMANCSNIPEDVRKEAIEKFQEHIKQKKAGEFSSFASHGYVYIPNLRDIVRKRESRE